MTDIKDIKRECKNRSMAQTGRPQYALYRNGCFAYFTSSFDKAREYQDKGWTVVCKMLNGIEIA